MFGYLLSEVGEFIFVTGIKVAISGCKLGTTLVKSIFYTQKPQVPSIIITDETERIEKLHKRISALEQAVDQTMKS